MVSRSREVGVGVARCCKWGGGGGEVFRERTAELVVQFSVSHICATRYSHLEDEKVGVIAFEIERRSQDTKLSVVKRTRHMHGYLMLSFWTSTSSEEYSAQNIFTFIFDNQNIPRLDGFILNRVWLWRFSSADSLTRYKILEYFKHNIRTYWAPAS